MSKNNKEPHTPGKETIRESLSNENSSPLFDLRIALMVIFLGVVSLGYMADIPIWITITIGALAGGGWSLVKEKSLITSLVTAWKTELLIAAPVIAFTAYAIVEVSIQFATTAALNNGGINPENPPQFIMWLLAVKSAAAVVPPAVTGIAAGLILGVFEELFWRGFILTRLMIVTGHGVAALIGSALYGVYYFFLMGPYAGLFALMFGIALSLVVIRSKSLVPSILTHFIFLILTLWIRPDVNILL
ncbi:MAG: CPBP family intramembrane metalloprotease [Deltaproteobacteria bacterium]|nr:CPBP family intramembrane metalloprotease [Deltaproteobacteria bacterium]